MTVYVLPPRAKPIGLAIDVTTRSRTGYRQLSPMLLGPVVIDGIRAENVENAWQYSKVYPGWWSDALACPTPQWFAWRRQGFAKRWADRYPMGKGSKPLFAWYANQPLSYIIARNTIYVPAYKYAVLAYQKELLKSLVDVARRGDLTLVDFDAYDHHSLGYTLDDVLLDPTRKMGHGFVLAMMIEERIGDLL